MNLSIYIGCATTLFAAIFLPSCAPVDRGAGPELELIFAPQAVLDCRSSDGATLPETVERVMVQREAGQPGSQSWKNLVVLENVQRGVKRLVTSIPEGLQSLRFVACGPGGAEWMGTGVIEVLGEHKHPMVIRLNGVGQMTCNGTGRSDGYQDLATPEPAAFLSASATLPDGRTVVVGGAEHIEGDRLSADPDASNWSLFEPREGLFLPGFERAIPLAGRRTIAPRVGAVAVPLPQSFGLGTGVLVVGGAPSVTKGPFDEGPLLPALCPLNRPPAELLRPSDGRFVALATEPALTQRFLPGIASTDAAVLVAGGIDCGQDPPRASSTAELLTAAGVQRLELGVRMAGPTVTALRDGRFLVWGHDLDGSGQAGVMVDPGAGGTVTPLRLTGDPACGSEGGEPCWRSTAYHSATHLMGGGLGGTDSVLVFGGLRANDSGQLVNNPNFGADARANFFVLELAGNDGEITAFEARLDGPEDRRALHGAVLVDNMVLVSGGWIYKDNALAFDAARTVLGLDGAGRSTTVSTSSAPRLGHLVLPGRPGQMVIAGGMSPNPNRAGEFEVHRSADVYTTPLTDDPCAVP